MSPPAFTPESGRQSPFKRQNSTASASPSTVRTTTPTQTSPIKPSNLSPSKSTSLSPEKASPFVRRPSQISQSSDRPSSPFARPSSSLSIAASPSRQVSNASKFDATPSASPRAASVTPAPEEEVTASKPPPSPSPFDGPAAPDSPSFQIPSQANLRSTATATAQRPERASSTTSTIKAPTFTPTSTAPKLTNNLGGYTHIPQPLLRSMRESFEVLDTNNTGAITSTSVASIHEQMGLPHNPASITQEYFNSPPHANLPAHINLSRYLDVLSAPMSELSSAEELAAAFSAFDVDDSGQIDVAELRNALLNTAPEAGEQMVRLSERDVDGILGEFAGRRAFGAKGMNANKVPGNGNGEVFRWREFMGSISGGGGVGQEEVAVA